MLKKDIRYPAGFTVEATMVLGIVFLTFAAVIQQAYRLHDTVTGTMILTETLEKTRFYEEDETLAESFKKQGEEKGNPRLWLGEYHLEIKETLDSISGHAEAGEWETDMEIKRFQPGVFLRRYEAIRKFGEELSHDGSGIQAGDESELHGDSSGTETE